MVNDSEIALHFQHIHIYCNEKGFDGVWRLRAGTHYQTKDQWPQNFNVTGNSFFDAMNNLRAVLREHIRTCPGCKE